MNPGGPQTGHNEITALDMRVRRIRTEGGTAGIPAEVMKFIAEFRHGYLANLLTIGRRLRVNVHCQKSIVEIPHRRGDRRDKGMPFYRSIHRQTRRWIERVIVSEKWHNDSFFFG